MRNRLSLSQYIDGILAGERLVLSRAITLVESRLAQDQMLARQLLDKLLPYTGKSVRVGITGVPGVGKSTFIETFGKYLTAQKKKLAVLAVDPSSQRSGGSLLGDKTRMETLSVDPLAYIRPSPAGDSLGGVARCTRETILLCEAAGFEVILVETVGVGQSETVVHSMVDFFLLLMLAGAGDELQGMKRGIMELADALVITKADGENRPAAQRAKAEYQNALHLFPPTGTGWYTPVTTCSALSGDGIDSVWNTIQEHQALTTANGHRDRRRQAQNIDWLHSAIRQQLEQQFYSRAGIRERLTAIEEQVRAGKLLPVQAAEKLFQHP